MSTFYKTISVLLSIAIFLQPLTASAQHLLKVREYRKALIHDYFANSAKSTAQHQVAKQQADADSGADDTAQEQRADDQVFEQVAQQLSGGDTQLYLPLINNGVVISHVVPQAESIASEAVAADNSSSNQPLDPSPTLDSADETLDQALGQIADNRLYLPIVASIASVAPTADKRVTITHPQPGETVSGPFFVLAQQTGPTAINEVVFSTTGQLLGRDSSPEDGFSILVDAAKHAAGTLSLTATARMSDGSTAVHTIQIKVDTKPLATQYVDESGGVLRTPAGTFVTFPANAYASRRPVQVADRTQEQIKSEHGIDFVGNNLTFLGGFEIVNHVPLNRTIQTAIATDVAKIGANDNVLNFTILPDMDGDGVDELVATGDTETYGTYVTSVPAPKPVVKAYGIDTGLRAASMVQAGTQITAIPGETILVEAAGFNAYALKGTKAIFTASDGTKVEANIAPPQEYASPYVQAIIVAVPPLTPGPATIVLRDLTRNIESTPILVNVVAAPPLKEPAVDISLRVLEKLQQAIELDASIRAAQSNVQIVGIDLAAAATKGLTDLREEISYVSHNPTEAEAKQMEAIANLFVNSNYEQRLDNTVSQLRYNNVPYQVPSELIDLLGAMFGFIEALFVIAGLFLPVLLGPTLAILAVIVALFSVYQAINAFQSLASPGCQCNSSGATNGSTSHQSNGGNCSGNVQPTMTARASNTYQTLEGQYIVHIYVDGERLPFSGVTDSSGYFSLPVIPAGKPFLAIATNTQTKETRGVEGIGPAVGDTVYLWFDFTTTDQIITNPIAWDGGGDGRSWTDPANWDLNRIPQQSDIVTINVPGTPTIILNGNTEVYSLQSAENVTLGARSELTLLADSTINGTLTLEGNSKLIAEGAIAAINLAGAAQLDHGSFIARDGGSITAPAVTSIAGQVENNNRDYTD